ncbi:ABC transporter permease [Mangrovibacter plantisponsor]|uniref:Pyoverdine export ATP-binding/permease protein PvdT n=1 Tax=Mangrovibacter plantisponsor TaxID=451513 RepID=A0A317PWG0_9ENTR|nr:ABC transporter permease [Mangrovibacter plantisponsor]PWW07067.1 macrolide transport system ATP-binding/permease protein [Mangrovibacter plantisponsor]
MHSANSPYISLNRVSHQFANGQETVCALNNITLEITRGEFVAIVGPSGSGKSTLMNIIGCLDTPSAGERIIAGTPTQQLSAEALSTFRGNHIGFVFQRYHLLPYLNALENVCIPASYTGMAASERKQRAAHLLNELNLGDRLAFRPNQLSGGQQQRVSIARALMNGADIILADEPTGALDSTTGQDVMSLLHTLNQAGHTIIVVTHDPEIAAQAHRVITLHDGHIISDIPASDTQCPSAPLPPTTMACQPPHFWRSLADAIQTAWRALTGHKVRALLSMLGIIIGIASVIASVAIGEGAHQRIMADISQLDHQAIEIRPGLGWATSNRDFDNALSRADLEALKSLPFIERLSPVVSTSATASWFTHYADATITGVSHDFLHNQTFIEGQPFYAHQVTTSEAIAVIESRLADALFTNGINPTGQIIHISGVPFRISGVVRNVESRFGGNTSLRIWIPWTAFMQRLTGDTPFQSIQVSVTASLPLEQVRATLENHLEQAHGQRDFFTVTNDSLEEMVKNVSRSMTLLTTAISAISLLVGGVGVMNIMLVSVTERIHEIGLRLSVGARPSDIKRQFLIEAMVICLLGGIAGIASVMLLGVLFSLVTTQFTLVFTFTPVILACAFSALVGLGFGYFPARNAARMNPVTALAHQ